MSGATKDSTANSYKIIKKIAIINSYKKYNRGLKHVKL